MGSCPYSLVQTGSATIATGNTTVSVDITSVDMTKSILFFSVRNGGEFEHGHTRGKFTDSDTIYFARASSSATYAVTIEWYVVSFTSGVTVQRGEVSDWTSPEDVTITTVDTSKSFPIVSVCRPEASGLRGQISAAISSSTNLQMYVGVTGTSVIGNWQVVEYTDCTVQRVTTTSWSGTSKTDTISTVDTTQSIVFVSYAGSNSYLESSLPNCYLTGATSLYYTRYGTVQISRLEVYVVEFTDTEVVRSGQESFSTSDTNKDVTISSVDTARSAPMLSAGSGFMVGANTANSGADSAFFTVDLTTSTNVNLQRVQADSAASVAAWQVIQFQSATAAYVPSDGTIGRGVGRGIGRGIS